MVIEDKIILEDYKCFQKGENGLDNISPINIIIGRNNSGKSSLLDLVEHLVTGNSEFLNKNIEGNTPSITIEHKLKKNDITSVFKPGVSGGGLPTKKDHLSYGMSLLGKKYTYKFDYSKPNQFISFEDSLSDGEMRYIRNIAKKISNPFHGKIFCKIEAERNITPEKDNIKLSLNPNGQGATNYIQRILNITKLNSNLVEKDLLNELNKIIKPDILFNRILIQSNDQSIWEVYFEDKKNNRIALSKMGSGIKTILLVLLNLIIRPSIENKTRNNFIYAFEELENNLHPALQRRLYEYIFDYSIEHSAYFFLTTHSNVVIDSFSTRQNVQLIHIINDDGISKTKNIFSHVLAKEVLKDIGIKASDLLQNNGIIWVEGPSDRNYINRWIKLSAPDLVESLHYSIMFYGGRLLSNLSFDYEWLDKKVIPLLKINTNAFVIIDRDGKTINSKLNKTKQRIMDEIGQNNCWITKGREIENYLSSVTIEKWLKEDHKVKKCKFENDENEKIENIILKNNKGIKLEYNKNKTIFSNEINKHIDKDSLNILDLNQRLDKLIECIKDWNS